MEKTFLLNVSITNQTEKEILEYILLSLEKPEEKYYIVTPNPEILVYAHKHRTFQNILNNARLGLPDGIGVILAGKILGKKFSEKVTGVDLMEKLCKEVAEKPITVGFLGGGPKIAERTAECLVSRYPGLKVAFVSQEWGDEGFDQASKRFLQIQKQIRTDNPRKSADNQRESIDVLFVAYGFPKQEEWIAENLGKIPVRIAMTVGGSFDYISGEVKRAPLLIRLIGFEWLFRLIIQPWRIKRQLALLEFMTLVLKEKLSTREN